MKNKTAVLSDNSNVDIYEDIKNNNPVLFSILKEQQKSPWEITNGDTYETADNTSDQMNRKVFEKTLNYYSM